jgi:hypothetical protein
MKLRFMSFMAGLAAGLALAAFFFAASRATAAPASVEAAGVQAMWWKASGLKGMDVDRCVSSVISGLSKAGYNHVTESKNTFARAIMGHKGPLTAIIFCLDVIPPESVPGVTSSYLELVEGTGDDSVVRDGFTALDKAL